MGDYTDAFRSLGEKQDAATEIATGAATPPTDAPDAGYQDAFRMVGATRANAAKGALLDAGDADPEKAGRAVQLAPEVGAPASVVEGDLPAYEELAALSRNARVLDGNPVLARWLAANPPAARVAKDDFQNLDAISKTWAALSSGWSAAFSENKLARLYNTKQAGELVGADTPQTDTAIAAGEAEAANQQHLGGAWGVAQKGAGFVAGLLDNFLQGQTEAAAGAVAGGIAGAAAGGVGAAPGAAAGYAGGAAVGFLADMARVAAGETYRSTAKIVGRNGEALAEPARQIAALAAGVGTYVVGGVGAKMIGNSAGEFLGRLVGDAVTEAVSRPTVARALAKASLVLAKGVGEGAAVMTAMEGVSVMAEEFAMAASQGDFATLFNSETRREEVVGRLATAAAVGAVTIGMLHVPAGAAELIGGSIRARQATSDMAAFKALEDGAVNSNTRRRSLDAFTAFLRMQADGSPVERLFIPGAKVAELYQGLGVEPGAGDRLLGDIVPDLKEQLDQAAATGGDIVVPAADYIARLAGTPVAERLRGDIRVRSDAWTLNEAAEYEKERQRLIADNAVDFNERMAHELAAEAPVQAVFNDIFGKLRAAGHTNDAARQYAALYAAHYGARAARFEGRRGDAEAIYRAEGLDVRRVLPASLEHIPVDDTDMVLNALRNRAKLPSDKELFGPSLLEFIQNRGGMTDNAGELAAMDAHKWRVNAKGDLVPLGKKAKSPIVLPEVQREDKGAALIRDGEATSRDATERSLDDTALAAWEAGYFPEAADRPEINDFLEAVRDELAGRRRYAGGASEERRAGFVAAVHDLDEFLARQGLDVETMSNGEIKAALAEYQRGGVEGREFEQGDRAAAEAKAEDLTFRTGYSYMVEERKRLDGEPYLAVVSYMVPVERTGETPSLMARGFRRMLGLKEDMRGQFDQSALAPELKEWFGKSKVVGPDGKPRVVYHGAAKPDRIAKAGGFKPERATSGPMAFFTDSPELASSYGTKKGDTSHVVEDYATEWTVNGVKGLREAFLAMPAAERIRLRQDGWRVTQEETEVGPDTYRLAPEDARSGYVSKEHWAYSLRENRNNPLLALWDIWHNSGQLFQRPDEFRQVLKTLGIKDAEFDDPDASNPGVFPVYLKIEKPLDTAKVTKRVIRALEAAAEAPEAQPDRLKSSGDIWDKFARDPHEWVAQLIEDVEKKNNSHVWTSIPDWVTATLRDLGYDGIKDTSGKMGGEGHEVWIPFAEDQVRSIFAASRQLFQAAYHGTPHIFDRFDIGKVGTGEGHQAFGWGLYFAGNKEIAEYYRAQLTRNGGDLKLDGEPIGDFIRQPRSSDNYERYKAISDTILLHWPEGAERPSDIPAAKLEEAMRYIAPHSVASILGEVQTRTAVLPPDKFLMREAASWRKRVDDEDAPVRSRIDYATRAAVAEALASRVTAERPGRLYHVELAPKPDELLDWDEPLKRQPEPVQRALEKYGIKSREAAEAEYQKLWGEIDASDIGVEHVDEMLDPANAKYDPVRDKIDRMRELRAIIHAEGDDDGEVHGGELYRSAVAEHGGDARAASLALREAGVRGIRYADANSRGRAEGQSHNYVIFDDADIAIREFEQGARGRITLAQGRAVIELFKGADLSTFLHETGHLWLDELMRDAAHPQAPEGLREDAAAVLKWMKVASSDEVGVAQHEAFARAFEAYLMEGRAPSTALGQAFAKFKAWLTRIYRDVAQLDTPIDDRLRAVFDRLVATETETNAARETARLNPIFASAADAGMTAAEFKAYTDGVAKAKQSAEDRLLRKVMAAIRAERTAGWREEEAGIREGVDREVRGRPDLKAQYWMRTGRMLDDAEAEPAVQKVRLSKEALADLYGNDEAPGLLPKGVVAEKGGVHPDEVAELFGYPSGDALVKALMSLEAQRRAAEKIAGKKLDGMAFVRHLVDDETRQRMLDRHGDALNDGSIEEEAVAAVHNAAQAEVMALELRALARKAGGEPPIALADLKAWVTGELAGMPVGRGVDQAHFARAEARAGRLAERALLKGDLRGAFVERQRQLVNHLFAAEAGLAREEYEKGLRLFERYATKPAFAAVEQAYTDRIHELLKRVGYDGKRSDAELRGGLGGKSLGEFVAEEEGKGHDLGAVASFLLDGSWRKDVHDMTLDEFMAVKDAVANLAHVGRSMKTILDEGRRADLAALVDEAVEKMGDMRQRDAPADINPGTGAGVRGVLERLSALMRYTDAALLKQEQVFDWLDGRDPAGVFNRVVFRRLKDAQHRENDMLAGLVARVRAIEATMPAGWSKRLNDRMEIPELPDRDGAGKTWRRQDVLAMALNMGNRGNAEKLVRGYRWRPEAVQAVLDRTMTKPDWDFVQGIWDTFETLYPEIEAMTRRVTGVGPEKVDAVPVTTRFGDYRGGYFPVVYDPLKSHAAELRAQRAGADMFENNYTRATTPKGHTIARVENYAAPIRLSLDIIPWKLGQAVHDLAFREAVIDADKFLSDRRIRSGVDQALGHEYTVQFRRWLQSIANERNIDDKGLAGLDWLARKARVNTTVVGIGFRVSTMVKHGSTALFNSFGELGAKWMLAGAAEVYGSPDKFRRSWEFMTERSGELRHRMNSIDRDVRDSLRTLEGEHGWIPTVERFSHYGVAMLDMGSALPTWMGAYRKALASGTAEPDAVYIADKAVRNAHGAQGVTDLSMIQRGGEVAKLFTMFYGFFNHIYNRQRDTLRGAGEGLDKARAGDYAGARRDFAMVLSRSFFYLIIPATVEAIVAEGMPDEDKGETWLGWFAKAIVGEVPAGIPLLRDAAKFALNQLTEHPGHGYTLSPVSSAVETTVKSMVDLGRALGLSDKEVSSRWLQHAVQTPGYIFGLPTGQAGGTAQYLWDLLGGEAEAANTFDVLKGLMYGPKPKH